MLGSLAELVPVAHRRFGEKAALVFDGRTFSFSELHLLSNRFAAGLASLGVKPGDRVTIYAGNSWEWMVTYYGALKAGAVVNPLNVMLTPEEVEFVVEDCGAAVIVASSDKAGPLVGLKERGKIETVVVFGEDVPKWAASFDRLIEGGRDEFEIVKQASDALSTICYTSGTTGHPKGAMLSHRSVMLNAAMTAQMHVRTERDVVVIALPLAHVYGNVIMNGAMLTGMKLVLHKAFSEEAILEDVEAHRATMFEGVPTMYMYLLNHAGLDKYDLSSLTRCTVGGQTMPVAKMREVERRFGCPLIELWGMTEMAGLGTTHPFYGEIRHGSIGISLPYMETRVVGVDDPSRVLPAKEVGELMCRGPLIMQGYYNNEKATRETIEPDGWLHTGDLAYMDEDGYFFIVDRKKDMILTAGYNVYPAELERVIAAHPSVALVAVGSVPDEAKGELAKAYIVLKQGARGDAESVLAHCRQHLAAYKVPRLVQFVADLPKTSTGKVMRRALRQLDA